jgi:hypothetical protein
MKSYIPPEFEKINVKLTDNILSSDVENFSSYIADPGDWGDIDPDDEIIW